MSVAQRFVGPGDRVSAVHVVNPLEDAWQDRTRDLPAAIDAIVESSYATLASLVKEAGLEAEVVVHPAAIDEATAPAVARIARELEADGLMVLSKRASGLRGMLLGSVAQALLTLSPCPVIVARPRDATEVAGGSVSPERSNG